MRIAFDTNVVLDVILKREPFLPEAAALFAYVHEEEIEGVLCATTLTTVFYFAERKQGSRGAYECLDRLFQIFDVAPVDGSVVQSARALGFADYEDAVLHESARQSKAHGIVTRNPGDFAEASLTIYEPLELLALIEA